MQKDLQITLRSIDPSPALESYIRERADKLDRLCTRLTGCHVTIDTPHRHKSHGRHFHVRIDLAVPGEMLVVARESSADRAYEDAHAALDLAFDDARRLLKDYQRRRREL